MQLLFSPLAPFAGNSDFQISHQKFYNIATMEEIWFDALHFKQAAS